MKNFEFSNSWSPKIHLEVLSRLGDEEMFSPNAHQEWVRTLHADYQSKKVQLIIQAAKNDKDTPETSQLNAINFILNNEEEIYQSIYENLKEKIYPHYSELSDVNIQEHAPLSKIEQLPKVLGLVQITVHLMSRNQMAWCTYMFEWKGDEEHGLTMLFEGSKYLKYAGAGSMWFDEVVPADELEELRKEWIIQMPKRMYYPNKELQSYKPWQLEKTKDFLIDLLRENKFTAFKELVSHQDFDVNQRFPEDGYPLIEEVVRKGYMEAAMYLHDLGANTQGLMHFGNPFYENTHRIEFVNRINGDINELNEENISLLEKYLIIADRALEFDNLSKMDLYKTHIKLLLDFGAKVEDKHKYKKVLKYMNLWDRGKGLRSLFRWF